MNTNAVKPLHKTGWTLGLSILAAIAIICGGFLNSSAKAAPPGSTVDFGANKEKSDIGINATNTGTGQFVAQKTDTSISTFDSGFVEVVGLQAVAPKTPVAALAPPGLNTGAVTIVSTKDIAATEEGQANNTATATYTASDHAHATVPQAQEGGVFAPVVNFESGPPA